MLSEKLAKIGAGAIIGLACLSTPILAQDKAGGESPTQYEPKAPELQRWSFAGFFGSYDPAQLQRGLKVYREVCSNCHSLNLVAFRNLAEPGGPGYTMEQVRALAAEYKITDGPNDQGDMFERPGIPSDHFPAPFANEEAAKVANNGAAPPDLSLIAKSRGYERRLPWNILDVFTQYQEGGPDYIHALLTGFQDAPEGVKVSSGTYYNPYFQAAPSLSMPPPLSDGQVTYDDGSPETLDQYARDVSAFLMWTAEPKLVARKQMGFRVFIMLIVLSGMMYLVKRKVWASIDH